MSAAWVSIGALSDIPVLGARRVVLGERTIGVFRTEANEVFAIEDSCPHKKGPLSNGIVHGDCVTCPLHNWVISLKTGQAQGADEGSTETFPVRVSAEGLIELDISAAQPDAVSKAA